MARMDAMTIKIDAQYKEIQSRAKQPTPDLDDDDIPMSREEEAKFMQTFRKTRFYNDYRYRDKNRDNCYLHGYGVCRQKGYAVLGIGQTRFLVKSWRYYAISL
ncbi:hypothetical protein Tco_0265853 [Tanacetum coccineum]